MKKILLFVFLICFQFVTAQNIQDSLSVSFKNVSIKEAILEIEESSSYSFYFIEDWFDGSTLSGDYKNEDVNTILSDILKKTDLNFYIININQIVLIKNNIIYDELPSGFFGRKQTVVQVENAQDVTRRDNPIFYGEGTQKQQRIKTINIGKKIKGNVKDSFTLKGIVTDLKSGKPIPSLALFVNALGKGVVTDDEGYYEIILPPGAHMLETQSFGSEDLLTRVVIYNNGELNLSLNENYEQLGEVYIESNTDANVVEVLAGTETIKFEEIKTIPLVLGERDILKVATTLPGISSAGEGAAGYNVRGGKADQNLILLDNGVIFNPSHFFGLFSALNPFTSGEINIYKGSIPAKYGGRLSSVFEINTKNASTQKFGGEASIGPVTGNLALEIPIVHEKSGLLIGGRGTFSEYILRNLDEESLNNSEASFYDLVGKYHHNFDDKNSLEVTGYYSRDKFSVSSDSLFSYSNRLASFKYDHKFNNRHSGSLIFSNSDYQFNIDYENHLRNSFRSGYRINESEVKFDMQYRLNTKHSFNYGISSKLYLVEPGEIEPLGEDSPIQPLSIQEEKGLESAVFLEDSFRINDQLTLNAGVRYSLYAALGESTNRVYQDGLPKNDATVIDILQYDNNEVIETYHGAEARISARYLLKPDLSVKAGYSNTFQYIHTLSNNTTISPTDIYKLSDANIEPQRATQYTLGLFKNIYDNMYELSVEGYYKNSDDILDFETGANLFLNENVETEVLQGEGRSYGLEFLVKKTKGRLNGWLGYTYSKSEIKLDGDFAEQIVNNGEYFPSNFDKPHDLSIVANYKVTKRFSFSANFAYQTGRPVTYPTGKFNFNGSEFVTYSDRNKFRIPDYYRLDVSFNVEGNHKIKKFAHSFWNISIYNVLGRNNPYSVFFVTKDGKIEALQSSIFSIPIPTITYNFKF
ncbi:TonB-dependent receptor domain-containing protein [Gillisia sp. JM1]|uniref:TonB-dependent receptor n=1 Tax=Gillisia sp. JM1 TaxID=1283286 RepID=UPI00041B6696|nr:TonB-dependent receptor [Gillisia sp. JM1]